MRIFALEYYRKMLNSYQIHFTKEKKKAQLRIKDNLDPFVYNNREASKEAEEILERFKLKKIFVWRYDPQGFICDTRMKNKLSPYFHNKFLK